MKLKDKVALIFGGSGGIGIHIAEFFCREGARVIIAGKNPQRVRDAVRSIKRITDAKTLGVTANVADYASVQRAVKNIAEKFRRIDILVNCAGIQEPIGPFKANNINAWKKNISVNLFGTVHACQAVIPSMARQRSGSIINFSGGGGTGPRPNFSAYAVAKTGIARFTEILAGELKPYHIRANAIAPGAVNTRMLEEVLRAGKRAGKKELAEARKRKQEGGTSPELAAALAVFLASPASAPLTGRLISAPWDDWKNWKTKDIKAIMSSEKFTLRRIA